MREPRGQSTIDLPHQLLADFNGLCGHLDGGYVASDVGAWYRTFKIYCAKLGASSDPVLSRKFGYEGRGID